MELNMNDPTQFSTIKDATKKIGWFLDNCEKLNNPDDPDFDPKVVLLFMVKIQC